MIKDILQPLNTSGKPKEIKIGNTYPHAVSRQYTADMRRIIKAIAEQVRTVLIPELEMQIKARDAVRQDSLIRLDESVLCNHIDKLEKYDDEERFDEYEYSVVRNDLRFDDSRLDSLSEMLVQIQLFKRNNILSGEGLATEYATKTYIANELNIANSIKRSVGIAIKLPEGSTAFVDDWVSNNSLLIQDLQEEYLTRIQRSVANGYVTGKTTRSIAKDIQKATGITWRRAQNISRNEIGNLNAEVNQQRSKELGIDEGIWRTMKDERVRGNPSGLYPKAIPSHFKREGERFKLSEGIDGEMPGEPPLCRCWYQSVINLD